MSPDDLDVEPLGRGEALTLEELEALDEHAQRTRGRAADPADTQFVADMAEALHLDLSDPVQRRKWLAAYNCAERRRKATVRRRRGAR